MRVKGLNRTRKVKILSKLFAGETAPLVSLSRNRSTDYSTWTDEEIDAEYERLRQREYRETGVLPPPMPDFAAMSDEELRSYKDGLLNVSQ
jgi:hypothetical protein